MKLIPPCFALVRKTTACLAASISAWSSLCAAEYFVSTTGSDANPGSQSQPFATIQHAVNQATSPGDIVTIAGGIYYEWEIKITAKGLAGNPITIRAAANEEVVVDHGLRVENWSKAYDADAGFEVWEADLVASYEPKDDNFLGAVLEGVAFRDDGNFPWFDRECHYREDWNKFYITVPQGQNPSAQEIIILSSNNSLGNRAAWRFYDFSAGLAEHIIIDGITIQGAERAFDLSAKDTGFSPGSHITIQNCTTRHIWRYAARMDEWHNVTIRDSEIYQCGLIFHNREFAPPESWPHAIIGFDADNILVEGCDIHDNNGEGVGPYLWCSNWTIRNNRVYDNWSINIYIDTDEGDMLVENNLVYNTGKYDAFEKDYADGIRIGNEAADLLGIDPTPGVYNVRVLNNIVINAGHGIRFARFGYATSYIKDSLIAHNTVVNSNGGAFFSANDIWIKGADNLQLYNNIAWPRDARFEDAFGGGISIDGLLLADSGKYEPNTGNITANNVRYESNLSSIFTNGTGYTASNYTLMSAAAAIDAGISVPEAATDYLGQTRSNPYDFGAIEYTLTSGYASWSSSFSTPPEGDENADGVANLLAYALGANNAQNALSFLPSITTSSSHDIHLQNTEQDDVIYVIQSSGNLNDWEDAARKALGANWTVVATHPMSSNLGITPQGSGITLTLTNPPSTLFWRLIIEY